MTWGSIEAPKHKEPRCRDNYYGAIMVAQMGLCGQWWVDLRADIPYYKIDNRDVKGFWYWTRKRNVAEMAYMRARLEGKL